MLILRSLGKPAKLFDETNPDWAPSLLLGYSAKNTDPSRHRRLEKRRAEKRQADAEKREAEAQTRRAEADAVATGIQPCSDQPISPHQTGETYADESDTGKLKLLRQVKFGTVPDIMTNECLANVLCKFNVSVDSRNDGATFKYLAFFFFVQVLQCRQR